jgi:hypothetical protein
MKYEDLTLNQRILIKGMIDKDNDLQPFKAAWLVYDFRIAVNLLLDKLTS